MYKSFVIRKGSKNISVWSGNFIFSISVFQKSRYVFFYVVFGYVSKAFLRALIAAGESSYIRAFCEFHNFPFLKNKGCRIQQCDSPIKFSLVIYSVRIRFLLRFRPQSSRSRCYRLRRSRLNCFLPICFELEHYRFRHP